MSIFNVLPTKEKYLIRSLSSDKSMPIYQNHHWNWFLFNYNFPLFRSDRLAAKFCFKFSLIIIFAALVLLCFYLLWSAFLSADVLTNENLIKFNGKATKTISNIGIFILNLWERNGMFFSLLSVEEDIPASDASGS